MKNWYLATQIIYIVGALVLFARGEYEFSYMALIMASLCKIEYKLEEIKGGK